jgi:coproporphyrinogen III oxidase
MNDTIKQQLEDVRIYLQSLQQTICDSLTTFEVSARFKIDAWEKPKESSLQGYGSTALLQDGQMFEQVAVNFSDVSGKQLPESAQLGRPQLSGVPFYAMGISLIVHPHNPYIPTTHMNVRLMMAVPQEGEPVWWFGGGFDLTPYYAFEEDCIYWHQIAKQACDPFGGELYPQFKKEADDYFYLPHRKEHRGIGGIFFDNYNTGDFAQSFAFMQSIGNHFLTAYLPIVRKRKDHAYDVQQKAFQLLRRGRYVEFNLLYDRGTKFGLQSGGRVESILASLPPQVIWQYDWKPAEGSVEDSLVKKFLTPRDWVHLSKAPINLETEGS